MKHVLAIIAVLAVASTVMGAQTPEPAGWYAGDMHVHRSCGGTPESIASIFSRMTPQNLAVVSQLADSGNGEVQNATTDLPLVNGQDASVSTPGHILHWDTEWHWDATYSQYGHQALGGHIVNLGLSSAQQLWQEYTFPILDWAHQHNGIAGFAHLQYLDGNGLPNSLTCCAPIEFPVEVALGAADFISEDVDDVNQGPGSGMYSESPIQAYYKLLNSGFRPGFAAGTDYPCNGGDNVGGFGGLLTYVQMPSNGALSYGAWVQGIANGRTVVSRNGHNEFLNLTVNGTSTPGDELDLSAPGNVSVTVQWTAAQSWSGTIELVQNGTVIASLPTSVTAGSPATLTARANFAKSGWLAARRMGTSPLTGNYEHYVHTGAVFVIVGGAPIRASQTDAQYFVNWTSGLLQNTSAGGAWNSFFPTSLTQAQARYQAAKAVYQQVASEASGTGPTLTSIALSPANATLGVGSQASFSATGTYSNGSSLNITGQVRWASSNAAVAGLNPRGLASALSPGSSLISASLGGVTSSTGVTVAPNPLAISTQSLPSGIVGTQYSSAVAAAGGQLPYTWSISGGSLPPGVALNTSTGAISGTPTGPGTFHPVVQVVDSSSPAQVTSQAFTVSVAAPTSCPCSLWPATAVPAVADAGADAPLELGVEFRADFDGYITGIRFYKSAANVGIHVGNLWTSGGTRLATATFSGESASGWQQVQFASPVPITAGTLYVASYHLTSGHYAADKNYFALTGVDNSPLHAPQDGVSTPNGMYAYGSGAFPGFTWSSTNYWVDAVFMPAGPDTTPPTVLSVSPAAGSSSVDPQSPLTATFSKTLSASTLNANSVQLLDASKSPVQVSLSYNPGTGTLTLTPTSSLVNSTTYTAVLKGGLITNAAGNALAADYSWSFTTAATPPPLPTEGPGGPILIVSSSTDPFSRYYTEILRNEGLNEFTATDISLVSSSTLSNYSLVILGHFPLTSAQAAMFTSWVNGGGNLIAMRPDKQLRSTLGLSDTGMFQGDGYLLINTTSEPGSGLVDQTVQYHGNADLYIANGASVLATLYSTASTPTPNPAVTLNRVGLGQAAAFTYDLARSVVYTRQGNTAWSGQSRDSQVGPVRSDNLFFGGAPSDRQPDYVDRSKIAIPQADEQQRLLANLIIQMNSTKLPLPRFWYLPRDLKAAVVMTGDDHGSMYDGGATGPRFDHYIALSPAGCSVADWQCVRASAYLLAPTLASNLLTNAQAASYIAQGFEVGVHVDSDPDCADWTTAELAAFYTAQISSFASAYPSVAQPKTHRMHCVSWSDYDSQPQVELQNGIRLDADYYYWPPEWVDDTPGLFTGSGMPMRFTKRDGTLLDIYQATTQLTDESGQSYPLHIDTLLNNALGPQGYYGVFTANMHNDDAQSDQADAVIQSAQSKGVPIISAAQLLTWLDGRNGSSFNSLSWNGSTLTFGISVAPGANGLEAMLPMAAGTGTLHSISLNGSSTSFNVETIKGIAYAVFPASAGTYRATYISSIQVPAAVSISSGNSQSAPINSAFPVPLTVTVTDALGAPIPNYGPVNFTAATGANGQSGTFTNKSNTITGTTDSNGQLSEAITANSRVGSYQVAVTAGTLQAQFTLTNLAGPTASISVVSGSGQTAIDLSSYPSPLVVNVTDAGGNPVVGAKVTFAAPQTGASVTFAGNVTSASTDAAGNATSAAMTANSHVGGFSVTASVGSVQAQFALANSIGPIARLVVTAPATAFAGLPLQLTASAYDGGGNFISGNDDPLKLSSSDSAAMLPNGVSLTNGTAVFKATLNSTGTQTISAADTVTSATGVSGNIAVAPDPNLVVTTSIDDVGTASNCTEQPVPASGTDASCSLRDALLEAQILGGAHISFDAQKFASSTVINAVQPFTIPAGTSIEGPISGSGPALKNLLTVNGGAASGGYPVFIVPADSTNVSIANLTIAQGNSSSDGGCVQNAGGLSIFQTTITGCNAATGGGISNASGAVLAIAESTLTRNTASIGGGGIFNSGILSLEDCTIANNVSSGSGGGILSSNSLSVRNSTVSSNFGLSGGGITVTSGSYNLKNTIVSGNREGTQATPASYDDLRDATNASTFTSGNGGGDVIGFFNTSSASAPSPAVSLSSLNSFGGPVQTMLPLPGSPAICAGLPANLPTDLNTDQRGFPSKNTTYAGYSGTAGCVDAGSVQTNYSLSFRTEPPASFDPNAAIAPAPVVALIEVGGLTSAATGTVTMSDSSSLLSGTSTASLVGGNATFSNLRITAATPSDTLFAALPLTPALSLTAVSTPFNTMTGPSAVSVTPSSGYGLSQKFTFVASSPKGASKLAYVNMLFAPTLTRVNICYVGYIASTNLLTLVPDSGSNTYVYGHPGAVGKLSNSQCAVDLSTSTVAASGNTLTVAPAITFKTAYTGPVQIYMNVGDAAGLMTNWKTLGTWTVANGPWVGPNAVSVTPSSGYGFTQQFTFVGNSPVGIASNLVYMNMLFSSAITRVNTCYVSYTVATNQLSLVPDDGSTPSISGQPGATGTLSNSQCSVDLSTSKVTAAGNTLTVAPNVTFRASFVGPIQTYLNVGDVAGLSTGFKKLGTWTVGSSPWVGPNAVSVTPSSGYGFAQQFTFVANSPNGLARQLTFVNMLFSATVSRVNTCYVSYVAAGNQLSLAPDDGSTPSITGQPGASGTLSNSQCSVDLSKTTVTASGNTLTVAPAMTFRSVYTGPIKVYMNVGDVAGLSTGWKTVGSWAVGTGPWAGPRAVSVMPASGFGMAQRFTFVANSPNGIASNLTFVNMLFSSSITRVNTCYVSYVLAGNQLSLVPDDGSNPSTSGQPGASGTLKNTQCSVDLSTTTVTANGNTLTAAPNITFLPAYTGPVQIYMNVGDAAGLSTGWVKLGTWTVGTGPWVAPTAVSVTPSSGSGFTQQFTFVASSPNGIAANLSYVNMLFSSTIKRVSTCYVGYVPATNVISLVPDDGGTVLTSGHPGATGTLSNSQCSVNLATSTVRSSGNTLTVAPTITFRSGYTSPLHVYVNVGDVAGLSTGWTTLGTWTP